LRSTSFQSLSRIKEKGSFTLSQFSLSELIASVGIDWVEDYAILTGSKSGDAYFTDNPLVYVRDVNGGIGVSYQPLFSNVSVGASNIYEAIQSFQMKSTLSGKNVGLYGLSDFFINVREVGTRNANQPLFSSLAGSGRTTSSKTKSLVRLDDDGSNDFNDLNFYARDVGSRTSEEPLVSCLLIFKITNSSQSEGGIRSNDLERRYLSVQRLTGIKRERLGNLNSDFFVTVAKLNGTVFSDKRKTILVSHDWILDNAEVAWRYQDVWSRSRNNHLVLLSGKCLRSAYDSRHIRVIIKHMNEVLRLDSDHGR